MTVTLSLFAGAGAQFFDNNGNPLSGGKLYTYSAGTTTPLATYTSISGNTFHTNPIVLDAAGRVPSGGEIWLTLGVGYKFVVKTSTEVLVATYDNIPSSAQPPAANDADSIMYEQGYTVTAGAFVIGSVYRIVTLGTTDFTLIGATANTVGLHFIATGVGSGTGTAELSQTVETKLRTTVSVKDFGAMGNGVTDDTAAIQAAINYSKSVAVFNNGNNSTPRGGVEIVFPRGLYVVASTITLNNINGLKFVGCGKETSMLVHTANSGSMFDVNQMLYTTFEDIGFAAGTITTNTYGNPSINIRASGSRTTNLFKWNTDAGGDRFNVWRNIKVQGGFARVWDIGGNNTHSESTVETSNFFDCDYVWYSDNVQSINTYFIACDAEFISESVFYYLKGGYLTVIGGSYINPKDTLTLAGFDTGIGTSNGQFMFRGVKWEMYQNIDPATSPKLLNSTQTAAAVVTFQNCSNDAGLPNAAKTFISVARSMRVIIDGCDFVGVIDTTTSSGLLGFLSFKNCRTMPTVVRNANGGSKYIVSYDNCGGDTGPILNKTDVDSDNSRVVSYTKNAVRLKYYDVIGGAGTTSLSFKVPTNVIFTNAVVTVARGGGVSLNVTTFMDAAKTSQLFTLNAGSSVTHSLWNPAITYSGAAVTSYVTGSDVYVDIVSGGNAGLVQLVITLEYVSHG